MWTSLLSLLALQDKNVYVGCMDNVPFSAAYASLKISDLHTSAGWLSSGLFCCFIGGMGNSSCACENAASCRTRYQLPWFQSVLTAFWYSTRHGRFVWRAPFIGPGHTLLPFQGQEESLDLLALSLKGAIHWVTTTPHLSMTSGCQVRRDQAGSLVFCWQCPRWSSQNSDSFPLKK